jgi:hypothetical protein
MATIDWTESHGHDTPTDPNWSRFFTADECRQMRRDDSQALTRVCMILLSIVAGGLLIGIVGVLLAI